MHGEVRIAKQRINQPGRPVGDDELDWLRRMSLQISLQETELAGRKLFRAAVVENGDMHRSIVKTVMRRVAGVLAEQFRRCFRPDVVVTRRKIKRITAVGRHNLSEILPLTLGRCVVKTLDGIADADDEAWVF